MDNEFNELVKGTIKFYERVIAENLGSIQQSQNNN